MKHFAIFILLIIQIISLLSQNENNLLINFEGSDPSFSPDGKFIAYVNKGNIWVIDLQSNGKKQVSTLWNDCRPRWSPNGDQIVFQSYGVSKNLKNARFSIWVVNKDGTNQNKLIEEHKEGDQSPFWSPNGKKIAWTHGKQLWIADCNGKNARPLTMYPADNWEHIVDWTKDGKTIMYLKCDEYKYGPNYYIGFIDSSGFDQKSIIPRIYTNYAEYFNDEKFIIYTSDYQNISTGNDRPPDSSTVFSSYLSKYSITDKKIFRNIFEIQFQSEIFLSHFNIAPDYQSMTYDLIRPKTDPKVHVIKLNKKTPLNTQYKKLGSK
jgi:Tol biopolymer transport system component